MTLEYFHANSVSRYGNKPWVRPSSYHAWRIWYYFILKERNNFLDGFMEPFCHIILKWNILLLSVLLSPLLPKEKICFLSFRCYFSLYLHQILIWIWRLLENDGYAPFIKYLYILLVTFNLIKYYFDTIFKENESHVQL